MVNLYQRQRHAGMTMLIVRCISCRNAAIIIVLSLVALFRSKLRRQTIMGRLYPTSHKNTSAPELDYHDSL